MALARSTRPVALVVDDDEGVRAALIALLEEEFEVLTATDGPTALQLLGARPAAVVLLDVRMPRMDGFEVLAKMRETDSQVPVIFVSALDEVSDVVAGMRLGAADYIAKPFDDGRLLACVRDAVNRQREARPGILLIGADLGPLAALQLTLGDQVRVTTAWQASPGPAPLTGAAPALVVVDGTATPEGTAGVVRALRERFPGSGLIAMEPPYRLIEVLGRITATLRARGLPSGSWERLGSCVLAALDYMAAHYQEPLGVWDVAAAVGLSEDSLAHMFRRRLGVTVKDYLERLRVTIAQRLLAETEFKTEDVAQRCGFADASHFSRVFVRHTAMRPGEYRLRGQRA